MAAITGSGGSVKVGANAIAEAKAWSLNLSRDILKSTPYGQTWHRKTAGMGDWTAKCTVNWDMSDTNGQKALQDALIAGTSVTFADWVDGTHNYSGTAFVKGAAVKHSPDGLVEVDFDLEGSGAPTYA